MKRKLAPYVKGNSGRPPIPDPDHPDTPLRQPPPSRQRQPQTSCDFCRLKKLKCDRAAPCSTCVTRRRPCNGPPIVSSSITPDATPPPTITATGRHLSGLQSVPPHAQQSVLDRLRRLEEAVFGLSASTTHVPAINETTTVEEGTDSVAPTSALPALLENGQPDYATACDSACSVGHYPRFFWCSDLTVHKPADYQNIEFRFAQSSRLTGTSSSSLTDDLPDHTTLGNSARSIWLPSKEGILALLDDYVQGQHLFLGIIDPQATRQLIDQVYTDLPRRKCLRLSHVALLLSIAATSAFFWEKEDERLKYHFSSPFDAANWSVFWRNSAWDLLDQLRRDVTGSLEELQATCILAQLISQIEGCPSRYRRLQGNAITIAREISLHVIDAPKPFLPWDRHLEEGSDINSYQAYDTEATREIKRRIWWHLAGTDWLLSVMGGPLYKSYTVNPLHMNVRYPRNINDDDLQNLTPWPKNSPREYPDTTIEPPTTFTYSILRLRVAEVCYKIVDALQPIAYSQHGHTGDGIEQLPYDEILRISGLLDEVLASFPASYALDAPVPPGAPPDLDLQRKVILLYFHARRARIFRPFLHSSGSTNNNSNGNIITQNDTTRQWDSRRYEKFAALCRDSARTVLSIASSLVSTEMGCPNPTTRAAPTQRPKIVHRSGLILMHLFMACVILASDPTLSPNNNNLDDGLDVTTRRRELAEGAYLLKLAGKRSSMASGLMDTLTVVLNRHKLRVFCNKGKPDCEPQRLRGSPSTGKDPEAQSRSGYPLLIQNNNVPESATQQQQMDSNIPLHAISGNFIPENMDDRDAVNDIWGIDRMQARILEQHVRNKRQRTDASSSSQAILLSRTTHQTSSHEEAPQSQLPSLAATATELLPLDGLWKDLVDAASGSFVDGAAVVGQNTGLDGPGGTAGNIIEDGFQWDQLFADLDYFVGPS